MLCQTITVTFNNFLHEILYKIISQIFIIKLSLIKLNKVASFEIIYVIVSEFGI